MPTRDPAVVGWMSLLEGGRSVASEGSMDRYDPRPWPAPIDDQGLAIWPEQDVPWLQVAMDHAPAVDIRHRLADHQESPQQLLKLALVRQDRSEDAGSL